MATQGSPPSARRAHRASVSAAPIAIHPPNGSASVRIAGRTDHRRQRRVTWYAAALIVMLLLLAAGLELLRWIVLVVTFD